MTVVLLAFLTFVSTALGGLLALHRRHQIYLVMAFSAGVLIAAALLDIFPEAVDLAAPLEGDRVPRVFLTAAIGFLIFYGLDRFVHSAAAGHLGHRSIPAFGSVAAFGLVTHSFLDGLAIGSGFRASDAIGWIVALAVITHDFGDGVSTVGIVLGSRGSVRSSIIWLVADAAAPMLGALTALLVPVTEAWLAELLGFFAGSFLFIGAAHLLPEAHQEADEPQLALAVVGGFLFIVIATRLAG